MFYPAFRGVHHGFIMGNWHQRRRRVVVGRRLSAGTYIEVLESLKRVLERGTSTKPKKAACQGEAIARTQSQAMKC